MGKAIVAVGLLVAVVGGIVWVIEVVGGRTIGRLPGDIHIERGNFSFYFPVATCILLSAILTLLIALFLRRR
jgi:hypothetical protein